jgi:hypothetical protein
MHFISTILTIVPYTKMLTAPKSPLAAPTYNKQFLHRIKHRASLRSADAHIGKWVFSILQFIVSLPPNASRQPTERRCPHRQMNLLQPTIHRFFTTECVAPAYGAPMPSSANESTQTYNSSFLYRLKHRASLWSADALIGQ